MSIIAKELLGLAMNLNFSFEFGAKDGWHFHRGDRRVWNIREGWQTADLIDGRFQNHLKFENLEDALRRPVS